MIQQRTLDRTELRMKFLTEIQTETQTHRQNEYGNSCISRLRDCHFESFAKELIQG